MQISWDQYQQIEVNDQYVKDDIKKILYKGKPNAKPHIIQENIEEIQQRPEGTM